MVLFSPLQPKSGFLPGAGCGGTKSMPDKTWMGRTARITRTKATFKAKPVS